ncbi:MAG: SDR family oxidoreductase [Flavobacteriales bacterium]|nr:SDR family oxidoreductase [Flavobacteriales bacterium]
MSKVAFITGGTSGIGRAICNVLHSKGVVVYGTGRKANHGDILDGFHLVRCDVTKDVSVREAIEYVLQQEGRIDVLVNNAGIGIAGSIEDSEIGEILNVFNTNVAGVIRTCKSVLPIMREQGSGYIINISSVGGLMGLPYRGIYSGSKSSVELISEAMSMEVMKFGIKVVLVEPGDFKTSINENRKVSEKAKSSIYKDEFDSIHEIINQEVNEGNDPEKIGRLVWRIINHPSPRVRYNTGDFMSKVALAIKRLTPSRWFEAMMMNHYKIRRR